MSEESCCGGGHCHSESGEKAANGVANPGVLDALAEDKVTGEVVLVMFEPRPWNLGDQHFFQLQEKLNAYMSFAPRWGTRRTAPAIRGAPCAGAAQLRRSRRRNQ
jgi:hypothetical protein